MVEYGYGDGEGFGDLEVAGDLWQRLLDGANSIFPSPEASLYRGPFMKVVLFDLTVAAPIIRPELYGQNFCSGRIVGRYSVCLRWKDPGFF